MPTTRKRGALGTKAAVAMLGILLSGAASGCSIHKNDDHQKSSSAGQPTPTGETETSTAPTPTPTPTPSPTTSTSSSPAATPKAALLEASDLPQLNASSTWTLGRTAVPGPESFGPCQQYDLLSIGALTVIQRDYTTGSKDTAAQQVAEYPDAQNTVRASKVLEAWHDKCKTQGNVPGTNVKIGPMNEVTVPHGKGWWYLVSYTRKGTGHFSAFGMTYSGSRMVLLTMDHDGQDHSYPAGKDPMELAVKAASAKLG